MDTLYKEELLEHYREPQNFGKLVDFTISSRQTNPLCGDDVELFVQIKKNTISAISFQGNGCAVSIAATSVLTQYSKGKSKDELTRFSESDMLNLLGIEVSETRKKCALLALSVLKDCLLVNLFLCRLK